MWIDRFYLGFVTGIIVTIIFLIILAYTWRNK